MPNIEGMKDQLVVWGLIPQVWELTDSGFSLVDAISIVYKAHTRGTAFIAVQLAKAA